MANRELGPQPISTDLRVVARLKSDRYEVLDPFTACVETWEDGRYIARWPETEAIGFGDSAEEAFGGLLEDIEDLYDELRVSDPETLGPLPQKWLRVMGQTIAPVESIPKA